MKYHDISDALEDPSGFAVLGVFAKVSTSFRKAQHITKTSPGYEDPLTPHFYTVKLGFTGIYVFLIFASKHRLWVLVRTASLINVFSKKKKEKHIKKS